MKKTFYHSIVAALALAACLSATSCGSDDDDSADAVSPVAEELKPFVGKWEIGNAPYYFYQDKQCEYGYRKELHAWNYDATTKILAVTGLSSAQWQITASAENEWTGISMAGSYQAGITAKRDTVSSSIFRWLAEGVWVNGQDTLRFGGVPRRTQIVNGKTDVTDITSGSNLVANKSYGYRSDSNGYATEVSYYADLDYKGSATKVYTKLDDGVRYELTADGSHTSGRIPIHYIIEFVHPYSYEGVYMNVTIENNTSGGSYQYVASRLHRLR